MNDYEFWLLMGVYALHTVLVLGAAYLIMRAQNAFNAKLHREVNAAIVNVSATALAIREEIKKPETFKAVGAGIAQDVKESVRNSLAGMYGNVVRSANGAAKDPISKFFYVLTAKNKAGAIKKVMMDGPQTAGDQVLLGNGMVDAPGPQSGVVRGNVAAEEKLQALNAEVSRLIESDPAMQKKIDAKAKELGLVQ